MRSASVSGAVTPVRTDPALPSTAVTPGRACSGATARYGLCAPDSRRESESLLSFPLLSAGTSPRTTEAVLRTSSGLVVPLDCRLAAGWQSVGDRSAVAWSPVG